MNTSQEHLFFTLIVAVLLVGALIGYFLFSMMRQFDNYLRLQDGYSQAKLEALEQERQIIAADLHDDIGPILSVMLYKLGGINPVPEQEKELHRQALDHIGGIFKRIRTISTMLVPQAIERKGPFYALEEFAETYLDGQPLNMEILSMPRAGLDGYSSLHLFRILQEILHNTLKHAKASRLTVDAWIDKEVLYIETEDDGIGFDPAVVQSKPGLGLKNLAIRSRMLGATLSIISWPGKGTRYRIWLPLNAR
jgi:signal transduction histidine kinase